jgi:hypothetical protein
MVNPNIKTINAIIYVHVREQERGERKDREEKSRGRESVVVTLCCECVIVVVTQCLQKQLMGEGFLLVRSFRVQSMVTWLHCFWAYVFGGRTSW